MFHQRILTGSIGTILRSPDGTGGGGPNDEEVTQIPADFDSIGKIAVEGEQPSPEDADKAAKEKEAAEAAAREKEASDAKAKEEETKKAQDAEALKKQQEEQQRQQQSKADEDAKRAEADRKAKEEAAKNEVPDDDKDIDALNLPENAPTKTKSEFANVKAIAKADRQKAREATQRAKTLEAQVADLTEKAKQGDPAILKENEELRAFRQRMELENDPELQKEFKAKSDAADERLYAELLKQGMKPEVVEDIKKVGIDKKGQKFWDSVVSKSAEASKLGSRKIEDLLMARNAVADEKAERLSKLANDREGFMKERAEQTKQEVAKWGETAKTTAMKLAQKYDFMLLRDVPANATAEEKASIEAMNKAANEYGKEAQARVSGCYLRDPVKTTEVVMRSLAADHFEKEAKAAKAESEKLNARIKELEDRLAARKNAGSIAGKESSAAAPVKHDAAPKLGQTADEALDEYMKNKS